MHPVTRSVLLSLLILLAVTIGAFASYGLSYPIAGMFINLYTRADLGFATFWLVSIGAGFLLGRFIRFARPSLKTIVLWSGIISGIPIFLFYSHVPALDRGAQKRTIADMRTIGESLESYRTKHGSYPSTVGIKTLESHVHKLLPPEDAWGTPFLFSSSPSGYSIVSFGNDGKQDKIEPVGATIQFSRDIVFKNGELTAFPEGVPR